MIVEYHTRSVGSDRTEVYMRAFNDEDPVGYKDHRLFVGSYELATGIRGYLNSAYSLGRSQGNLEAFAEATDELKAVLDQI